VLIFSPFPLGRGECQDFLLAKDERVASNAIETIGSVLNLLFLLLGMTASPLKTGSH
jgi:hypothetical protein